MLNKLRYKLTFAFAILLVLMSLASGLFVYFRAGDILTEQQISSQEKIAAELSFSIQHLIGMGIKNIQAASQNKILSDPNADRSTKLDELIKMKSITGIYEDMILSDAEGNVITATDYLFSGRWKHYDVFQKAMRGEFAISRVHFIPSDPPRPILSLAGPIYDKESRIIGTIGMQLNIENIIAINNHLQIGNTGFAQLLDEDFNIIADPDRSKILEQAPIEIKQGVVNNTKPITANYSGREYIGSYYRENLSGSSARPWTVVILQDKQELLAPIRAMIRSLLSFTLMFLILAIFISIMLSGSISKSINSVKQGMRRIIDGHLDDRISIKSKDEIGELAAGFNSMAESLKRSNERMAEYNKKLEEKVNQRTKKLQKNMEELSKFNKMTVNREIKMIELKGKIKELEDKLANKRGG